MSTATPVPGKEHLNEPEMVSGESEKHESKPGIPAEQEVPEVNPEEPETQHKGEKDKKTEKPSEPESGPLTIQEIVELLLNETFQQLISIVGSQTLREIVIASQEQLVPYFPTVEALKFSFAPEFSLKLFLDGDWNDKRTLAMAVYLQSVLQQCGAQAIGMRYFDVREIAGRHASELDKIAFFDYMSHADELAQGR